MRRPAPRDAARRPEPYRDRQTRLREIRSYNGWRLKIYTITYDGTLDWPAFERGLARAVRSLPRPAALPGRPGVGFAIAHHGRGADYLVVGYWDRDNELPLMVYVRPHASARWRKARGSESVCVWDLAVIWREREAYVKYMLREPRRPKLEQYLKSGIGPRRG